jgi:hypothetical protein
MLWGARLGHGGLVCKQLSEVCSAQTDSVCQTESALTLGLTLLAFTCFVGAARGMGV